MPNEMIQTLIAMTTPAMLAITGAYIRSILKKVDRIEEIEKKILEGSMKLASLDSIKQEWGSVRIELARLMVQIEKVQTSAEELSVLKRDVNSVWANIDKIKDSVFDLKHQISQVIGGDFKA